MKILFIWEFDYSYFEKNISFNVNLTSDEGDDSINSIIIRDTNFNLDSNFLFKYKNLKYIYSFTIWTDNIDLWYCEKNNIIFVNDLDSWIYSVAELAVSLFLSSTRNLLYDWINLKSWRYKRNLWNNLTSKKIWILWYWNIWKITSKLLYWFKSFTNFEINVFDVNNKQYDEFALKNFVISDNMKTFLNEIDYLIIHVYGWKQTHNLINKSNLKYTNIKWIINISRPFVVNENDILLLLNQNKLDFYTSDVVCGEPNINQINSWLIKHPKVFLTPHIWSNTQQVQKNILDKCIKYFNEIIESE